jgi:hypothetical protein
MAEKSKSTEKSLSTFFSTHNLKLIQGRFRISKKFFNEFFDDIN